MNRRDLFRGAGALALLAAMPAPVELPMSPAERYRQVRALRAQWEARVLKGVSDRFWEIIQYGDPEAEAQPFEGLRPRYALDIGEDAQPDKRSVWLVKWAPDRVSYSPDVYREPPRRVR